MAATALIEKPSKALNLTYVIFGYVLASILLPPDLSVQEQLVTVITVGGLFGTFLFLVKPIDRLLVLILAIKKDYSLSPSASPLVAEDKMKMNAAVFFSLSVLLSEPLLSRVNLSFPLHIHILGAIPTLVVAVWEALMLVLNKARIIEAYYRSVRAGQNEIAIEISRAIEGRDWEKANSIITREDLRAPFPLSAELSPLRGEAFPLARHSIPFCVNCGESPRYAIGPYCPDCGRQLLENCPSCKAQLGNLRKAPSFCPFCGLDLKAAIENHKKD